MSNGPIFSAGPVNYLAQQNANNFATPIVPPAGTGPVAPPQQQPQCNLIWKDSVDAVLDHPRSPNETLYFGHTSEPIIYVRETDSNGQIKNPLHALHYTVEEVPFGQEAKFVTKAEHQQLYDLVASMNKKLEDFLNS